jgi:hypothetical protein
LKVLTPLGEQLVAEDQAPPTADSPQSQIAALKAAAEIKPDTQSFLAFIIILGAFGLIVLVIFHPPPQEVASTIFTLIGSVVTLAGIVGSFYFGNSKTSARETARDATMDTLVNKVTSTGNGNGAAK